MVFDMSNETDVNVMAAMVAAFNREGVEFRLDREISHGAGADRTYVKLTV